MHEHLALCKKSFLSKHLQFTILGCLLSLMLTPIIAQTEFDTTFIGKTIGLPKVLKRVIGNDIMLLENDKKKYNNSFNLHIVNTKSKIYRKKIIELPKKLRGKIESFTDFYIDKNFVCYLLYDNQNILMIHPSGEYERINQKEEYNNILIVKNDTIFLSFSGYQ